jgi:hypothetical protein
LRARNLDGELGRPASSRPAISVATDALDVSLTGCVIRDLASLELSGAT